MMMMMIEVSFTGLLDDDIVIMIDDDIVIIRIIIISASASDMSTRAETFDTN